MAMDLTAMDDASRIGEMCAMEQSGQNTSIMDAMRFSWIHVRREREPYQHLYTQICTQSPLPRPNTSKYVPPSFLCLGADLFLDKVGSMRLGGWETGL
jgi:hypothetical protein